MHEQEPASIETFFNTLPVRQQKKMEKEYKDLAVRELLFAALRNDADAVKKLVKIAGLPRSIVSAVRAHNKQDMSVYNFFAVLEIIGVQKLRIDLHDRSISLTELIGQQK